MGIKQKVAAGLKKGVKKLASAEGKKFLKGVSRQVKGKVKKYISATCPTCHKAGEWAHKAAKIPIVKKGLQYAEGKVRKKCKACGEVIDILQA